VIPAAAIREACASVSRVPCSIESTPSSMATSIPSAVCDPHTECVRLVDDHRDLGSGVVAPGTLVAYRQHTAARRDLHPVGAGPGVVTHQLAALVRSVGQRLALSERGRNEQVAVPRGHAHHAVGLHPRPRHDTRVDRPPHRELDVVGRQIADRRDPAAHCREGVRQAVQRLLLDPGH
jgi:hypothetical protein